MAVVQASSCSSDSAPSLETSTCRTISHSKKNKTNKKPGPPQWEGSPQTGTEAPCAQQTYVGSILVSVNPYRMFGIYGPEQVQQYSGRALVENPP